MEKLLLLSLLLLSNNEARFHHSPNSISPQQFYDFAHLLSHWSVAILTDEDLYLSRINLRNVGGEYNEIFTNVTLVDMYNEALEALSPPTVSHRSKRVVETSKHKDAKCNLQPPKESELSCPRFKRAHFDPDRDLFLVLEECYGRLMVVDLLLMEMRFVRGTVDIIDFAVHPARDNRIIYYLTSEHQYVRLWRATVVLNKRPILRTESRTLLLNISVATAARRQARLTLDNINTFRAPGASTVVTRIFVLIPDPLSVVEMSVHRDATTTHKTLRCSDQSFRNATVLNFFYQDQFGVTTAMLHNKKVKTLDTYVGFLRDEDSVRDNCMVRDLDHQNIVFGRADAVTYTHSHWLVTSANLHKCTHSSTRLHMRFELSANRGHNFRLLHTWTVPVEIRPDYWVRDIVVRSDLLNMGQPDDIYVIDSMGLCSPYSGNFNDEPLFAGAKPIVVDTKKAPPVFQKTSQPPLSSTLAPTTLATTPAPTAPPITRTFTPSSTFPKTPPTARKTLPTAPKKQSTSTTMTFRKPAPFRMPSRDIRLRAPVKVSAPITSTVEPTQDSMSAFLSFLNRVYSIGMRGKRRATM